MKKRFIILTLISLILFSPVLIAEDNVQMKLDQTLKKLEQIKKDLAKLKEEIKKAKAEAADTATPFIRDAALKSKWIEYEVKKGDTLSKIAIDQYGKFSMWKEIFEYNKDIIKEPTMLKQGMKIKIPLKEVSDKK